MIISLSAKNKIGFVDGTILQPESNSPNYASWHRANSMVISWILNYVSKNIADSVLFFPTAHQIRNELNQRYEQSDGALIYQMQQQLYSLSQGADDFSSYFTKFTKIWDEIRMVQSIPNCSCGAATTINKFFEDQKLIQLLMGLNESYKIIRGQLLMMKPLPNVSTAYSLIIQEERQRGINVPVSIGNDTIAMQVSSDSSNLSKKLLTCHHCKKSGHTKAQCYRLVEFPANFKFTKNKKDESKSTVQNVINSETPMISQDQYQHLIQLLNNNSIASSSQVNLSFTDGAMQNEGPFSEE